jgi:RNA polymerase sigma-70 factor, ECF subfamily
MRNLDSETPVSSDRQPSAEAVGSQGMTRLLESLRPDLLRFAHWLARDRALAEDIVQEAMLRAWRSRDALSDPTRARAWLMTIVRREHARLYERKRLELVCLDEEMERDGSAFSVDDDTELQGLRAAILALPLEYREPLILQVLGGFTTEEIARELSLTTPAVLTRLFRARNKLRTVYGLTPTPDVSAGDPP